MHHKIGSIAPINGKKHAFAQIYILDQQQQIKIRTSLNGLQGKKKKNAEIAAKTLAFLQSILTKHNSLIQQFKTAHEIAQTQEVPEVQIVLEKDVKNKPTRTYNAPTCNEIAAIIPTINDYENYVGGKRNITIQYQSGRLHKIDETSPLCVPMAYVLLHPKATLSFPYGVQLRRSICENITVEIELGKFRRRTKKDSR